MPLVTARPQRENNGDIVTEFVDTAGPSGTTWTYASVQNYIRIENRGVYEITVTVGETSVSLDQGESWESPVDFSSFAVQSTAGTQQIYVRAIVILKKKSKNIINVMDFGAKGDGVNDDYNAIALAVATIKAANGGKLIFPTGKYRIGRGLGRTGDFGGLTLDSVSNIHIQFDAGSVLYMDNLNASGAGDQCHGILVKGNCENIVFENATVEWATYPSSRSLGDGIRLDGGIDPETCPRNIKFLGVTAVKNTPQAGVIFHGCRDISIETVRLTDTRADGLHFNANHSNITVQSVVGENVWDDVVAFVTYYDVDDPSNPYTYSNGKSPFNSPDFTTRNNNHSYVGSIIANGPNHANALRISGGYDIVVNSVQSTGRKTAVIVDSVVKGATYNWSYLASRKIRVNNIHSLSDDVGFHVEHMAEVNHWETDDNFGLFDVTVGNVKAEDSTTFGVYIESCRGVTAERIFSNKEIRVRNFREVQGDTWSVKGAFPITIIGNSTAYTSPLETNMPEHLLTLSYLKSEDGGIINFQDVRGLKIDNIYSRNANKRAVSFTRVVDARIELIKVKNANRTNSATSIDSRAISLSKAINIDIDSYICDHDANTLNIIEVGGGDANDVSKNIRISSGVYRNMLNQTTFDAVVQGGSYSPVMLRMNMSYFNGGEASPVWRYSGKEEVANGPTENRPVNPNVGVCFYDTTLQKPIWYKGSSQWIDAIGTVV